MNIKKKIVDNWSLDTKDNYSELREKVSFINTTKHKQTLWFKGVIFSLTTIILAIFVINLTLVEKNGNIFDGDEDNPTVDGDQDPSSPDEGIDGIITGLESGKINFNSENVYNIYVSSGTNIDGVYEGVVKDLVNEREINLIISLLNDFEYVKVESSDIAKPTQYELVLNNGVLKIHFDDSNIVVFEYDDNVIIYETNVENYGAVVLEKIK